MQEADEDNTELHLYCIINRGIIVNKCGNRRHFVHTQYTQDERPFFKNFETPVGEGASRTQSYFPNPLRPVK